MKVIESLIRNRLWIIAVAILLCTTFAPSHFQKGGLRPDLLALIVALALAYLYAFFLEDIPFRERIIIPLILWPFVFALMSGLTDATLSMIFDTYDDDGSFGVNDSNTLIFFLDLLYYTVVTLPLLVLMRIYCILFPYDYK